MEVKRWQIVVTNPDIKAALKERGEPTAWWPVANDRESAWRKFCTQQFGALKPNPADYSVATKPFTDPT